MKKIMKKSILLMVGILFLTGCSAKEVETQEVETSSSVASEVIATADAGEELSLQDEVQSIENEEESSEISLETFQYNSFLTPYKDELAYIHIRDDLATSELLKKDEVLELTNATVTKDYYLDANIVENAKIGDSVWIKDVEYVIKYMEPDGYGYSVELQANNTTELQENQYVYEDIYKFERTKDGKHYVILFCSGDYIEEEIYTGSVFFDIDCVLNAYTHGEVQNSLLSVYYETEEYPYISIMSFTVTEEGLILAFQNQIAG